MIIDELKNITIKELKNLNFDGEFYIFEVEVGDTSNDEVANYCVELRNVLCDRFAEKKNFVILPVRNGIGSITIKELNELISKENGEISW